MDIRKFISIFILCVFLSSGGSAFAFNQEYQVKYNEAILNIYSRIREVKNLYPELAGFSRSAVIKNASGFNEIVYSFHSSADRLSEFEDDPYAFKFSVKPKFLEDGTPEVDDEAQDWNFPILGLSVGLEVSYLGEMVTFNPRVFVEKGLRGLIMVEQGFLPFQLEVEPDKKVYEFAETITFTVRLKNLGPQAYKVLDLDEQSLYCEIDDMTWGNEIPQDTAETVVSAYGNLMKVLKVKGIAAPKETEIFCRYGMSFKGVRPYGQAVIRIQPPAL